MSRIIKEMIKQRETQKLLAIGAIIVMAVIYLIIFRIQ